MFNVSKQFSVTNLVTILLKKRIIFEDKSAETTETRL